MFIDKIFTNVNTSSYAVIVVLIKMPYIHVPGRIEMVYPSDQHPF